MTNVYIVKFIENEKVFCYTSVEAIYAAHTKREIGITQNSFYNAMSGKTYYKNRKVIVNKITAYNKRDIVNNIHSESIVKC